MKVLHLQTGDELFEINFEFWWKQPANIGSSAKNFVMLNRFLFLSKNPSTPPMLPNTNGQYQAAWNASHKFYEGTSVKKSCKIQLSGFFDFLFYISFDISRYHFYNFLELHSTLYEKYFVPNVCFFNGFIPPYSTPPH